MIYLSRSIRALPWTSSVLLIPPFLFSRASGHGFEGGEEDEEKEEQEGDEGITWTLVKQLNGSPRKGKEREREKARKKEKGIECELSG